MMPLIHEDFLLSTPASRRLYHTFADNEPILDYHCHLPPGDIAQDRQFRNLFEIWLEGDHYKWRAMRTNGVAEQLCTGDADPYDKFLAWARTVPQTLRNPLYHWTHLELKRYFDIDDLLDEQSASAIWDAANDQLSSNSLSAHGILDRFQVRALCTTDDPADSLETHRAIAASELATRVYPTYRPDNAMTVDQPGPFNDWLDRLAATCDRDIGSLTDLTDALLQRHDDFHAAGGRISDHGLARCFDHFTDEVTVARIFDKARRGEGASPVEHAQFATHLMVLFGHWDAEKGWTKQLHLGARRNNNTRLFAQVGPDTGFDSIGDWPQGDALGSYLDRLDQDDRLPKMILYNLNPRDNYLFATMIGNFQDGSIPGKLQYGSGWWFLDQKESMQWQLNSLSNLGLLSRFVGMLTDSRSFMSYPRHEYFRRILCDLLGRDVENGELPDDDELLGPMIQNICFGNARDYLGLEMA